MSDSTGSDNNVLDYLREQFARVHVRFDRNERDHKEIIQRIGSLERDFASMKVDFAAMQVRLDNLADRLDRVERRLDLVG